MKLKFREDKATEAAALFLNLRGGQMSYLKLIKLLYFAEREALLRWRRPITFDSCVSMDHGPALSQTLNLLNGDIEIKGIWQKAISPPANYEVSLLKDPGAQSLSEAEEALIREIFGRYGKMSRWEIRNLSHDLPEWKDPQGSSLPIDYVDILKAGGKTKREITSILEEMENMALMDARMGH